MLSITVQGGRNLSGYNLNQLPISSCRSDGSKANLDGFVHASCSNYSINVKSAYVCGTKKCATINQCAVTPAIHCHGSQGIQRQHEKNGSMSMATPP